MSMTLFLAGEILLINFSRDQGGGLGAFAAVFHQNHQNNFGVIVWREKRELGMASYSYGSSTSIVGLSGLINVLLW